MSSGLSAGEGRPDLDGSNTQSSQSPEGWVNPKNIAIAAALGAGIVGGAFLIKSMTRSGRKKSKAQKKSRNQYSFGFARKSRRKH